MYDGRELYYIEPREGDAGSSPLDAEHLVWKHSDLTTNFTCGICVFSIFPPQLYAPIPNPFPKAPLFFLM